MPYTDMRIPRLAAYGVPPYGAVANALPLMPRQSHSFRPAASRSFRQPFHRDLGAYVPYARYTPGFRRRQHRRRLAIAVIAAGMVGIVAWVSSRPEPAVPIAAVAEAENDTVTLSATADQTYSAGQGQSASPDSSDSAPTASSNLATQNSPRPTSVDNGTITKIDLSGLPDRLTAIIDKAAPVQVSVRLLRASTNEGVTVGIADPFFAASINKLITACAYLHRVEAGQANLQEKIGPYSAEFQLRQLINQSNNDSWSFFNDRVTLAEQEVYARSLGLLSFRADQNSLTAADAAELLRLLQAGQLLNGEHTALLLSAMRETNEERFIPPAVTAPGVEVYHKTGTYRSYVHDLALLRRGGETYVLAIFTNGRGQEEYDRRAVLIREITRETLSFLGWQ
jgi:beta-lactamase class A